MYFIGRNMLPMQGCTCLYNTKDCLVLLAELCYLILIWPGNELTQESNGTDVYLSLKLSGEKILCLHVI